MDNWIKFIVVIGRCNLSSVFETLCVRVTAYTLTMAESFIGKHYAQMDTEPCVVYRSRNSIACAAHGGSDLTSLINIPGSYL